ncbi:MAG TPA: tetratricopeptide repeat protein [Longimicrobiales bacterium]|nr:tetratricopeptide repeat protein [Longimicrobiales bacterium]
MSRRWLRVWVLVPATMLPGCSSGEDALLRGDRYWADSNYTAALAEYRLAASQSGEEPEVRARVAHAYVVTGQFERGRREYEQLVEQAPAYADQAIFDFLSLARTNMARGDRFGTARAAEAALALRPGLDLDDMSVPLARYYASVGDVDRALEFYNRAIGQRRTGDTALLFELASLIEQNGKCVDALPYFRAFIEASTSRDSATEARWRMGTCGVERGRQALAGNDPVRALGLFDVTLEVGAPPHLLEQAWLERGEALLALGRIEEARAAFERVLEFNPTGRTQWSTRAERRLQEMMTVP